MVYIYSLYIGSKSAYSKRKSYHILVSHRQVDGLSASVCCPTRTRGYKAESTTHSLHALEIDCTASYILTNLPFFLFPYNLLLFFDIRFLYIPPCTFVIFRLVFLSVDLFFCAYMKRTQTLNRNNADVKGERKRSYKNKQ